MLASSVGHLLTSLASVTFISGYRLRLLLNFPDDDFSYSILPVVIWSLIEIVGGIVSACLPVSKPAVLWTTHKLGLTGEAGLLWRLGSPKTWYGSGTKSAGETFSKGQSRSGSIPSGAQGDIQAGKDEPWTYLELGDASLFPTKASQARSVWEPKTDQVEQQPG